jgi:PhnB protein
MIGKKGVNPNIEARGGSVHSSRPRMKETPMRLDTYLTFNGRCEEAFRYYEKQLGGKIEAMLAHEGTPAEEHVPPEWHKKIMHAALRVGDAMLMGSDAPPQMFSQPQGFSVSVQVDDPAQAERIFNALSNGGTVRMPIQETFWAQRFGMLVDKFGIPWMINCAKPQ